MKKQVYLNTKYFRPSTPWKTETAHFVFTKGGLGDYINWMPAIEWLAAENPHIIGNLYVNEPFMQVARYILRKYENWKVRVPAAANRFIKKGDVIHDPGQWKLYINATGSHLLDLGFMYYAFSATPYEGYNRLPTIDYSDEETAELLTDITDGFTKPYAVFTPGATVPARAMPPSAFNELVAYTASKGVTPVFLGKADFAEASNLNYKASFDKGYHLDKGVNLLDKTTLLQATMVMGGASFVLGVDNGLLHFAGTTEVPIIFGHNVATVAQRNIRRPKGLTINIALTHEQLPCIGCQANMRYMMGHNFRECIYTDYKCLELLFANQSETWKRAIDHVINR